MPAETPTSARAVPVWDLPTRLFHWALVAAVTTTWTCGLVKESWMKLHFYGGYCVFALLLFRLAWGLVGSTTARFTGFIRGPAAAIAHLRELLHPGKLAPHPGHNPLGGYMVLVLLAALALQVGTGLMTDDDVLYAGPLADKVSDALRNRASTIHRYGEYLIIALAGMHLAAIFFYRRMKGLDLIGPMLNGRAPLPPGTPTPRLVSPWPALLWLALAGLVVWRVVTLGR